jgi:hypothetical protein
MKRMRIMGLGLAAIFAMTALFAASASAEAPEYGRCLAKTGGKFSDAGCTKASVPGTEKFEWYAAFGSEKPLIKKGYKSKSTEGTLIQLEGTGEGLGGVKTKVGCKSQSSEGEITGNKTNVATKVVFTGCESSGAKCKSPLGVEGEIQVNDLEGVIGVEKFGYNKEKKLLEPNKNKLANEFTPKGTEFFTEFECASLKVQVKGHVLNPQATNKMIKSTTVKFTAPGGNQKPEHFSLSINPETGKETFGPELSLEAKFEQFKVVPFEESGQTLTTVQTNEEGVEASSVN